MKCAVAIIFLLLVGQSALATKIPRVPVTELFERSTVVVFGRIESGKVLRDECGVEFGVRVANAFKGAKPGSLVWFKGQDITQIGTDYFLFLSPPDAGLAPFLSTNAHTPSMLAEYTARCKSKLPALAVNAHGWGAMQVLPFSPREVIVDAFVTIPPDVLTLTQLKPRDRFFNDHRYTELDAAHFTEYLRSLSRDNR